MTDPRTQRILEDLTGVKGQGFLFVVMLNEFVETLERRAAAEGVLVEFRADILENPKWFDEWCSRLGMQTTLALYAVAAKTLLKEYVAEEIVEKAKGKLEDGG